MLISTCDLEEIVLDPSFPSMYVHEWLFGAGNLNSETACCSPLKYYLNASVFLHFLYLHITQISSPVLIANAATTNFLYLFCNGLPFACRLFINANINPEEREMLI